MKNVRVGMNCWTLIGREIVEVHVASLAFGVKGSFNVYRTAATGKASSARNIIRSVAQLYPSATDASLAGRK